MKNTASKVLLLVLALSMVLGMASVASASNPADKETNAHISFMPGGLIIDPPIDEKEHGFDPFDLLFGRRNQPIRREKYVADGTVATEINGSTPTDGVGQAGPYTEDKVGIIVTDERATTTGWTLALKMGQFTSLGQDPFGGTLFLQNTVEYTNGANTNIGQLPTNDLQVMNAGDFSVDTDNQTVTLITAKSTLGTGKHGAWWNNYDIMFELDGTFTAITEAAYEATLTWVLTEI